MQIDNMVEDGKQNAEQNHSRATTYRTKSSHCISEDASSFTSACGQQIEKRMYNNSGAEVDMNRTPTNKNSHERYTKRGSSFVAVLRCTKAHLGIAR